MNKPLYADQPKNYGTAEIHLGETYAGHHDFDHLIGKAWLVHQRWNDEIPQWLVVTIAKAPCYLQCGRKLDNGSIVDPCLPRPVQKGEWFLAVQMMFIRPPVLFGEIAVETLDADFVRNSSSELTLPERVREMFYDFPTIDEIAFLRSSKSGTERLTFPRGAIRPTSTIL